MATSTFKDPGTGRTFSFKHDSNLDPEQLQALAQDKLFEGLGKEGNAFTRGLGTGIDLLQQGYGSSLEGVGATFGLDALEEIGAGIAEEQESQMDARRMFAPTDPGFGSYVAEMAGTSAPISAAGMAGAATGAKAGAVLGSVVPGLGNLIGATAGGIIGGTAAMIPFFYGQNRERQKEAIERGYRTEIDEGAAALTSIPQAALDSILNAFVVTKVGKLFSKTAIAKSGGIFTRVAKGSGKGVLTETPTEFGQQVLERYQSGLPMDTQEAVDEYVAAAAGGAILGGILGGGTGAISRSANVETEVDEEAEEKEDTVEEGQRRVDELEETVAGDAEGEKTFQVEYTDPTSGSKIVTSVVATDFEKARDIVVETTGADGDTVALAPEITPEPTPDVEPEPSPVPDPAPDVEPDPTPVPDPDPVQDPAPVEIDPVPTPDPVPVPPTTPTPIRQTVKDALKLKGSESFLRVDPETRQPIIDGVEESIAQGTPIGDVATEVEINENFSDEQLFSAIGAGLNGGALPSDYTSELRRKAMPANTDYYSLDTKSRKAVDKKVTAAKSAQTKARNEALNLRGRIQTKAKEESYVPTDLDQELEAIAPRGDIIETRKQVEEIVDRFRPIAAKLGFAIVNNANIVGAKFSGSKNRVEINIAAMFNRVSQGMDNRPTGTGSNYIVSVMREEIIHGAMFQVLSKKSEGSLRWYTNLGKSLTDAQREALNNNYNVRSSYGKKYENYGYGSEYARSVVQQFLYGNDTQSFTQPGSALEKVKALIKSAQAYITRALKTEAPKNLEAASIIAETADLLLKADPSARLSNQKTVELSNFLLRKEQVNKASGAVTPGVDPETDSDPDLESSIPDVISAETVTESAKPPSERKPEPKDKQGVTTPEKYLKTISSLLRGISPRLSNLLTAYYKGIDTKVLGYMTNSKPFFEKLNKIKNKKDKKRLSQLISYSRTLEKDPEKAELKIKERDLLLKKYGMYNDFHLRVRVILDKLRSELVRAGYDPGNLEDYFPRRIIDLKKVKEFYGDKVKKPFKQFVTELNFVTNARQLVVSRNKDLKGNALAIEVFNKLKELSESSERPEMALDFDTVKQLLPLDQGVLITIGDKKTLEIESLLFDKFMRQGLYTNYGKGLGNLKQRKIDMIPSELADAYASPGEAFESYVYSVTQSIETDALIGRRFAVDSGGSIAERASILGTTLRELENSGEITPDAVDTAYSIFKTVLTPGARESKFFAGVRGFSYFTLLVEFTSTLSQVFDLPFIMARAGIDNTFKAMISQKIGVDLLGIDAKRVSEEFRDPLFMDKAVRLGLKVTGFTRMDQFMKETNITANFMRFKKIARAAANTPNGRKFRAEMAYMGFNDSEIIQLKAALQKGDSNNALVRLALFSRLAETQPLTKAQMPLKQAEDPNTRLLYTMKSFLVNQLNLTNDLYIQQMRTGNKKQKAEAFVNLSKLIVFMAMVGMPIDMLKDLIAGRLGYLPDYAVNNSLRILGVSKFTAYKIKREGVGATVINYFSPVALQQFVDVSKAFQDLGAGIPVGKTKLPTLAPMSDVINRMFGFTKQREQREYKRRIKKGERPFLIPPGSL